MSAEHSADLDRGPFDGVAVTQRWMALDLWTVLTAGSVAEFDQWYDSVGFADAWSYLLREVTSRV